MVKTLVSRNGPAIVVLIASELQGSLYILPTLAINHAGYQMGKERFRDISLIGGS